MVGEGVAVDIDHQRAALGRLDERDVGVVAHRGGDVGIGPREPFAALRPRQLGANLWQFVGRGVSVLVSLSVNADVIAAPWAIWRCAPT